VAGSLPAGTEVVACSSDFTSVLFPFLAQDLRVELVQLDEVAARIGPETGLVAVSSAQSADGRLADLDAIAAAAAEHGALTFVDATQSCGWLPLDASRFDFVVAGAYKWLLSPRGTAFMAVRPERLEMVRPASANWYAGEDPWTSIYGAPLRLAASAKRFDVSPAWLNWVATAASLELIESIGPAVIHDHDVALANRFCEGLDRPPTDSAIVSVDREGAFGRVERAGIRASVRDGAVRFGFHLYNTVVDVDLALEALAGP
jgi:selenocysteine lyase/cysteine desulfurase